MTFHLRISICFFASIYLCRNDLWL